MRRILLVVLIFSWFGNPAAAQDEAAEPALPPEAISAETAARLDAELEQIAANQSDFERVERNVSGYSGLVKEVLMQRLDRISIQTLRKGIDFASEVDELRSKNKDVGEYEIAAAELLVDLPVGVLATVDRIRGRVPLPDSSLPVTEQAVINEKFYAAIDEVHDALSIMLDGMELAPAFGVDTAFERSELVTRIVFATENLSVFIDIAQLEYAGYLAGLEAVPDDADLRARAALTAELIDRTAVELQRNLELMESLDLNTARFRQQLLGVTGEVSASVFNPEVIVGVFETALQELKDYLSENASAFAFKIIIFFLIIFIFFKLAGLTQRLVKKAIEASGARLSQLLQRMVMSIAGNIVIIIGVLVALNQIGITLGPVLAGLGIAGFIVGFALQDSLSNFASGMLILLYRPFDVGDTIKAAGVSGQVSHMSLVNTTIHTFDNQSLVVPNNKIWQDVITNMTAQQTRRVDLEFGITFDQDIDKVEKILLDLVNADERVLSEPAPMVKVGSIGESSVNMLCRPWVKTEDYWMVYWDLNKQVKQAFDREGIVIPFPQRDVHITQTLGHDPSLAD